MSRRDDYYSNYEILTWNTEDVVDYLRGKFRDADIRVAIENGRETFRLQFLNASATLSRRGGE